MRKVKRVYDLKALFAYLKSRPPVKNRVPDYQPPKR